MQAQLHPATLYQRQPFHGVFYEKLRADSMKLTAVQIHEAFQRAVHGESVRSVARSMAVTEGALRWHFRKPAATPPREVRRIAWALFEAEQACHAMGLTVDQVKRLAGF